MRVASADVSEVYARAPRLYGRRRQISASEDVLWVMERAVALVVVLPARRRRDVYWLLAFVLDSISSSVVSLLVSVLERVVSLPVEYRPRISCYGAAGASS